MTVVVGIRGVVPMVAEDVQRPARWSQRAGALARWVERHDYRAYDPGDGQRSWLSALTLGQPWAERLLTAGVLRAPVNLRPILGIQPHTSTKGMGYMAWGYLLRYQFRRDPQDAAKARTCLQWLIDHRSDTSVGMAWGNDFTFTTRAGRIPKGEPTIVWSALIGQAFLAGHAVLAEERYLDVAKEVCRWMSTLPVQATSRGSCLSYVPSRQVSIHNANMLGAALLAQVGALSGCEAWMHLARTSMHYSVDRQREDGSWTYAQGSKYQWIDNFHTGYNLDSLHRYLQAMPSQEADASGQRALERGLAYYLDHFFLPEGQPRYEARRTWPMDIQCAAQSIDTLTLLRSVSPQAYAMACRVADWTLDHMQDPDGHFYYRKHRGWTNKTPMFHWGQATMFKALSHLSWATLSEGASAVGKFPVRAIQ
ncbi:MAG: hypothetical protein RI949_72 [Pseudomonadota bacterium]